MGNIARQSIKNFIWLNWGTVIGSIYILILVPKAFGESPELWGLIQLLLYYCQILVTVVTFSIPTVILRYYPRFAQTGNKRQFLSASILLMLITTFIVGIIYAFVGRFLGGSSDRDVLFGQYYLIIIPVILFSALFELFAAWSKAQLRSTVPNFLRESFIKTWNFVVIILFFYNIIEFQVFVFCYFTAYLFQFLLITGYINKSERIATIPQIGSIREVYSKEIFSFMGFNILTLATATLMGKLDIIMIGNMMDLEFVAYYSVALAMVSVVQLPEKSISAISVPTLSHAINKNDLSLIKSLYKKTSLNQFILCAFIFLGIWVNMHNISQFLGEKFGDIEYVVLALGLAKLIDVITGLNGQLIALSKHYKVAFLLQSLLVVLLFFTNLFFIPRFGINGAAFGSFISISIYNIIKTIFVYRKFSIWPFTNNTLKVLLILMVSYFVISLIHNISSIWIDIIVRSTILTLLYFILIIVFNTSEDINAIGKQIVKTIFTK